MANDRRRSHHDRTGVMQPESPVSPKARSPRKSPKMSPNITKSFSFRSIDKDEASETSRPKNRSSHKRKMAKTSPRSRSRGSSGSSDRSRRKERSEIEPKSYIPPRAKAMRRNSYGSNFNAMSTIPSRRDSLQDSNHDEYPMSFKSTDNTTHTDPLSYRDSERSDPRSIMGEDDKPIIFIKDESTRDRKKNGSEHSRSKHRKARRRNSCDYDYKSSRPSAAVSNSKAKRRNSFNDSTKGDIYLGEMGNDDSYHSASKRQPSSYSTHDNKSPKPSSNRKKSKRKKSGEKKSKSPKTYEEPESPMPSVTKARRRNSGDYDPSFDTPTRRNSLNDSQIEEDRRQSKTAKQRQPRRLNSTPGGGKAKKKKNKGKEVQTAPQQSAIRLNSQLMRKIGDFRPYFVPLKKKQEVLTSHSEHSQISQTFSLDQEIVSHKVNDGPAQILHEGMKNISVASFLHEGVPVVKVSHNKLGKLKRRVLTLSEDQTTLFLTHSKLAKGTRNLIPKQPAWTPSKGWNGTYVRAVDVANICDFQVGVISSRWLELSVATYAKKGKKNGEYAPDEEKRKDFFPYMPDPARVASTVTIFHIDARNGRMDSLDFFIENQDHRRAVVATLALMKYTYDEVSQLVGNEILLHRYIIKDMNLGTNENGMTEMNESEFLTLCRRLNFSVPNIGKQFRGFIKQHSEGSGNSKNKLPIHECLQFIQLLKGKENPSVAAWRACFGTATCVNALTVLTKFLHGPQQEEKICDIQDARDLVNVMNATELGEVLSNRKGSLLTQWQFQEFLRSEWNDIYCPEKRVIDNQRRLNKPLSNYWINSSFHTSSMSDGTPSIHSYTMALLRGCKSIDLNCWDGIFLPSGECVPIIIPSNEKPETSFTVKNKLTFRSVVLVVRKYLLENRKTYPIMFNLENNCSEPFQKSMVKTMRELFGKHLFVPSSSDRKKELPSPESLRGMIVVNVRKPVKRNVNDYRSKSFCGDSVDAYSKMFNKFDTAKPDSFTRKAPQPTASRSFTNRKRMDKNVGEDLISLSLFHQREFSGYFLESMDLYCSQTHGIKDVQVPKIVKEYSDNPDLWRKFNASHLTRIFPSNTDSKDEDTKSKVARMPYSNYNPVLAWGMGCQMASLNFHNDSTALAVNDGFFRQTGGIGYLEKPDWLLGLGGKPKSTSIKIRVLSGSCLPKPCLGEDGPIDDASISNPRVFVELHDVMVRSGHGERFKISKHKIDCSNKNGFFANFEDKGKKFAVETPDVAMLVFRVEQNSSKGKILSTTAVPVSCIRKGYRSVQLYDVDNTRRGHFASATLLVFVM